MKQAEMKQWITVSQAMFAVYCVAFVAAVVVGFIAVVWVIFE